MEKIRPIAKKLLAELKRRWWYICLLLVSTFYVWVHRFTIYQTPEITAQNIIFVLWLALLAVPLFSEIEIGSVKLKREIEQTRSEVKESIGDLKNQIVELRVSNSQTLVVNNSQPLPSKDELEELEKEAVKTEYIPQDVDTSIPEDNVYLFKVRYALEKEMGALCDSMDYKGHRTMPGMVQFLKEYGVISQKMASLIQQTNTIANRGVHGEIVPDNYMQFVRRTFPGVKRALDDANQARLDAITDRGSME